LNVSDVRQTEIHTAIPLVPGPSHLVVEIAILKLIKYNFPDSDQILAKMIQAKGEKLVSVIHKLIIPIWNMEESPDQWTKNIIVPMNKKGDKTD
jgi:hypothetical protein